MFKRMLKLSIKALGIGALTGALLFLVYGRTSSQRPNPRIVIVKQSDSPLLVLSTGVDSEKPLEPRYSYSVTNTSDKPISAYAIQQSVSSGVGAPMISTSFVYLSTEQLLLRPHESRQEIGGAGKAYEKAPTEVALSVDFVEFADGSRWGNDVGKSGARLDGQRAGTRTAIKQYREILAQKGVEGLELALTNSSLIKSESGTAPVDWQEGFRTGVSIVTRRLATAKLKEGSEGLKRELDQPLDSKGGRRDQ